MTENLLSYLKKQYIKTNMHNPKACIKYSYKFNDTNVAVYFDCYDKDSPSLSLVLVHKQEYYLKCFNPNYTNIFDKKYLENINLDMLQNIKSDGNLSDFYQSIEDHILSNSFVYCNYEIDNNFKVASRIKRTNYPKSIKPFFFHLRKVGMSDKHKDELYANTNISFADIESVQKAGFTIITTDDASKRAIFSVAMMKNKVDNF